MRKLTDYFVSTVTFASVLFMWTDPLGAKIILGAFFARSALLLGEWLLSKETVDDKSE